MTTHCTDSGLGRREPSPVNARSAASVWWLHGAARIRLPLRAGSGHRCVVIPAIAGSVFRPVR